MTELEIEQLTWYDHGHIIIFMNGIELNLVNLEFRIELNYKEISG